MPFAVKVGVVATPLPLVVMFTVVTLPGKVALAPLAGAVKVTTPPATGSAKALLTVAVKG